MSGYSQFGEEEHILAYFKQHPSETKRRFLDVGAHDGVSCSNTRHLAELGWGGTLVEPSPLAFAKLLQVYGYQENFQLVNAGVVPYGVGLYKFYESGGLFVGTFDDKHRDEWEGKQHVHYAPIFVGGVDWEELFAVMDQTYNFISIDVEGTNVELFQSLTNWLGGVPHYVPIGAELICVEHQGRQSEIIEAADKVGYEPYVETEANILLACTTRTVRR